LVFSSSFVQSPLLCSRKFQSVFLFLSPSRRRRHPIGDATMMMISRRRFLRAKNFEKKKKTETKAREETSLKVLVLLSKFVA